MHLDLRLEVQNHKYALRSKTNHASVLIKHVQERHIISYCEMILTCLVLEFSNRVYINGIWLPINQLGAVV